MTDKTAINAVYVDYKRVKGRKVHQIIFEVPSVEWPTHYAVIGEPEIDTSQWFAIAMMDAKEPAPTPEDHGSNLTANAAMMLDSGSFQHFLRQCYSNGEAAQTKSYDEKLKAVLNIQSKRELNTDPAAAIRWRDLRSEYELWMKG